MNTIEVKRASLNKIIESGRDVSLQNNIYHLLSTVGNFTAEGLQEYLPKTTITDIRSRLTELYRKGMAEPVEKSMSKRTNREITVWRGVPEFLAEKVKSSRPTYRELEVKCHNLECSLARYQKKYGVGVV